MLHHFLLGWMKKTLMLLKSDILEQQSVDDLCAMLDRIILWKVAVNGILFPLNNNIFKHLRNIPPELPAMPSVQ